MVSGLTASDYDHRLKKLNLLSLEKRRENFDLVQTFKIAKSSTMLTPPTGSSWLVTAQRARIISPTNYPMSIVHPNSRLDIKKNFFNNREVAERNEIPIDVKMARYISAFKSYISKVSEFNQN